MALAARPAELAKMRQLVREHRSESSLFNTKAWTQGLVSFVCLSICLSICLSVRGHMRGEGPL